MKKLILLLVLIASMLSALAQNFNDDLLLYYPFDGNADNAAVANANDGTAVGASLVEGFDGTANSAYSFDGINDQIVFGDFDLTTESFTVSFWIKIPEISMGSTSYRLLSKRSACNAGQFFDISMSNTSSNGYSVGMELRQSSVTGSVNTGNMQTPNTWNHITFVKDNATRKTYAYVNGSLVSTGSWSSAIDLNVSNTAPLGIGNSPCINNSNVKPFLGTLDEIRLHKRALSAVEINSVIPFDLSYSYPQDGDTLASVSSGIILEFTDSLDVSTVNTSNIVITAGGVNVTPAITITDSKLLELDIPSGFLYDQMVEVSISGVSNLAGDILADKTISFSTATQEESLLASISFDNVLEDLSVYRHDLTSNVTSEFVANRLGEEDKAIDLGDLERIIIPTSDAMNVGRYQDFTISFWMKAPQGNTQRTILGNLSNGRFSVYLTSAGLLTFRLASGTVAQVTTPERYDDDLWHHVAIVADRTEDYQIIINGSVKATEPATTFVNLQNLNNWYINMQSESINFYGGLLDDFAFYNHTLDLEAIKELAPIYRFTSPTEGELAAELDSEIKFEFGQEISAATAVATNFTVTGSKSGVIAFQIAGGDSRDITLIPDAAYQLDEAITIEYANLASESGEILSGTLTFETADINKGMLVHYPFDGNAENAASDVLDGTVSGATLTSGYDNSPSSAYNFDGNDQIDVGELGFDKESFAIAFWAKVDANTQRTEIFGQRNICTGAAFMELSSLYNTTTGDQQIALVTSKIDGGFQSYSARMTITPGTWNHIVAERDAKDDVIRIYKNGQLTQETTFSGDISIFSERVSSIGNGNACIGVDGRGRFKGDIDDFRIYKRSLSPEEIIQLSSFRLEESFPANQSASFSSTSSIHFDFNRAIDTNVTTAANVEVTGSSTASIDYTVIVSEDSIRISPDTSWPTGETLTVTLTDITGLEGSVISSTIFSTTIASEEESQILNLQFNGNLEDSGNNEFSIAKSGTLQFGNDRFNMTEKALALKDLDERLGISKSTEDLSDFNFGTQGDFTIATWFKNDSPGTQQAIFNQRNGNYRNLAYVLASGELRFNASINGVQQNITTLGSDYLDGTWHHVAFVIDRDGESKVYIDGMLENSGPAITLNTNIVADINIGGLEDNRQYWEGDLDEFRVFNKALAAEEIAEIAAPYSASLPVDGFDAIDVDQVFTLQFLTAIDPATAISANFTLTGTESGVKTVTVTGGDSRELVITPAEEFVADEAVSLSFTNLLDTAGNAVAENTFNYEVVGINKGMYVYYPVKGDATNQVSDMFNGVVNNATLTTDRNGVENEAYSFNGSANIVIGDVPIAEQSFTFAFWVKRDAAQQTQSLFGYRAICNASPQMNLNYSWSSTLNSYTIGFSIGGINNSGAYQNYGVSTPVGSEEWIHVSVVRDNAASLIKLYVDGTLEAIQSINSEINIDNSATLGIGSGSACINVDGTRRFTGDLDEIRIYNRAITDAEAAELPGLVVTPPTVAGIMPDVMITEDDAATAVAQVDTLFSSTDVLSYTATSSDEGLQIYLDGLNLMIEPAANYNGTAEVTISASNVIKTSQTFTVTTEAVNDAPAISYSSIGTTEYLEDFLANKLINVSVDQPADEAGQTITYSVTPESVDFLNVSFSETTGQLTFQAVPDAIGSQIFTITANDGEEFNNISSVEVPISVNQVNDAPVFELEGSDFSLTKNFTGTTTIGLTDLSPENEASQTITYSINPASVDFANVSIDANTGEISVTSITDATGSQVFTVTADDGQTTDNAYTATVTIALVENFAPEIANAIADVSIDEDSGITTLSEDITAVFTDQDGDALTYAFASSNEGVVPSLDGNALKVSLATDFNGVAIVSLTASDDFASTTADITVTVTPVNDAPVVSNPISDQTGTEGEAFSLTVPVDHISDVDGDQIQLSSLVINGQDNTDGSWLSYDEQTRSFTGTPTQVNVGNTSVSMTYTDASLVATDAFVVSIANVNDEPSVTGTTTYTYDEDAPSSTIDLSTVMTDADGDVLTFTIPNNRAGVTDLKKESISPLSFQLDNAILTVSTIANLSGNQSLILSAFDGLIDVEFSLSFTVNPINDAPSVANEQSLSLQEDDDSQVVDLTNIFQDVDGDALSFSVPASKETGTAIISYTLSGSELTVVPEPNAFGTQNIVLEATDGTLSSTYSLPVTISAVNDNPEIISTPTLTMDEDVSAQTLDLITVFSDVDGDAMSFGISGENNLATAVIEGSVLSITPLADQNGTANIIVLASDGQSETNVSYTLPITVTAINDAPVFSLEVDELMLTAGFSTTETINISEGIIPADEVDQTVTYTINSGNSNLVNITILDGQLSITSVPGASGTAVYTITADDGQSENNTFTAELTVTVTEVLSTQVSASLSVYPNPAQNRISIEGLEVGSIEISDMQGRIVLRSERTQQLDISNLVKGIYLIRITDEDQRSKTLRFVKY